MLASGGLRAYLMKAWNIFDLCMVLAGYTEFLPASVTGVLQLMHWTGTADYPSYAWRVAPDKNVCIPPQSA